MARGTEMGRTTGSAVGVALVEAIVYLLDVPIAAVSPGSRSAASDYLQHRSVSA
jgi:hypothetical protein